VSAAVDFQPETPLSTFTLPLSTAPARLSAAGFRGEAHRFGAFARRIAARRIAPAGRVFQLIGFDVGAGPWAVWTV